MAYIGQTLTEGTRRAYTFTATASQTTFNAVYGVGAVDVYQNGILLQPADYTATTGTTVVLAVGAAVNDEITIIAHNTFSVADTVSSSQGGTFTGNVSMSGTLGVTGAVTASNGLTVDDNGATPLTVDRATNDGTIVDLQKDGTSVGNIGVIASDVLYLATPDGTGVGINFDGDNPKVNPSNGAGAGTDGVADLGNPSGRWRDFYLSGGVYLGGTGAANKLEDVETGTFTAAVKGGSTNPSTPININGTYTKIGNFVSLHMTLAAGNLSGAAGYAYFEHMPFTCSNIAIGNMMHYNVFTYSNSSHTDVVTRLGGTVMTVYGSGSNQNWGVVNHNGSTNAYIDISIHYLTS